MAIQSAQDETRATQEIPDSQPHIKIQADGPYIVTGSPKLARRIRVQNAEDESVSWQAGDDYPAQPATFKLCRCGRSKDKPFCDDSHEEVTWDAALTADRAPGETRRQLFEGTGIIMTDDNSLCASFGYCDRFGGVWEEIKDTADTEVRKRLKAQIGRCPSGRLQYLRKKGGAPEEIGYEPMIAIIPNGPYWVLGSIPVETADGFVYEVRNRQLLCRCGQSKNKPFCDGTHWNIKFDAP
jgi:CDGSH-type Zn-finger protein